MYTHVSKALIGKTKSPLELLVANHASSTTDNSSATEPTSDA